MLHSHDAFQDWLAHLRGLSTATFDEPAEDGPQAAVAMLLRYAERQPHVLLMRRAERPGDPWSGQISLPGGRAETVDPDLRATAVRETQEEVGIALGDAAEPICRLPRRQARARGGRLGLQVTPFVFFTEGHPEADLGPEASEAFWFPLGAAARGELADEMPYEHQGQRWRLPAWSFAGHRVWGMTHGMLSQLLTTRPD
ncbi:MAG: NUDIX hydrolase [Planctomycetota bacterium]